MVGIICIVIPRQIYVMGTNNGFSCQSIAIFCRADSFYTSIDMKSKIELPNRRKSIPFVSDLVSFLKMSITG